MIKAFLFLILVLGSVQSFSQYGESSKLGRFKSKKATDVGIVERRGSVVVQLLYHVNNADTVYMVFYDQGFAGSRAIPSSFIFREIGGVLQSFYNALMTAAKADEHTESSVKLDKKTIRLETKEKRGSKYVYVDIKRGGRFDLSEADIQKLFGKE